MVDTTELSEADEAEELWTGVKLAGVDVEDADADVELALAEVEDVTVELPEVEDVTDVLALAEVDTELEAELLTEELAVVELWLVCEEDGVEAGEIAAEVVSLVAKD